MQNGRLHPLVDSNLPWLATGWEAHQPPYAGPVDETKHENDAAVDETGIPAGRAEDSARAKESEHPARGKQHRDVLAGVMRRLAGNLMPAPLTASSVAYDYHSLLATPEEVRGHPALFTTIKG